MSYRKLSLSLCPVLACFSVMAASAQQLIQLNPEQIQQIETMTSVVCTTVKEQKGSASRDQLQADVNAKIGGVFGKILPVEGAAGGSMSKENFEGLSRDATAAALEGDRSCRERVFNTMFDGFKVHGSPAPTPAPAATSPASPTPAPAATALAPAPPAPAATASTPPTTALAATSPASPTPAPAATAPPVTTSTDCAVNNPSGNPMNVRETPNGAKKDIISNRAHVRPLRYASAADGKSWAYVSDATGREIGWVFYPYLTCNGPGTR